MSDASGEAFVAAEAGELPDEGSPVVGGVQLPAGHLLVPAPWSPDDPPADPVAWVTDGEVDDPGRLLAPLRAAFADTGLWPVVLDSFLLDDARPWVTGELCPTCATDPADHDAETVLASSWQAESIYLEPDQVAPFGSAFPGLAPAPDGDFDDAALEDMDEFVHGRVALVPATRPADVLVQLGWTGPLNYYQDVGEVSAVLRSWEDRFGAVVVEVGFAELYVAVRRPPSDEKSALAVAAELFAFCPDSVVQGFGTIAALGDGIEGESGWAFWWD